MFRRFLAVSSFLPLLAVSVLAQGLNTNATKEDWEEINFETGSAVLTDGYPSLLRLAELLSKNPGYRVGVEGHTDSVGSKRANEKLGMARAKTVQAFLEKYGAQPSQISVSTQGMNAPKVGNTSKEGRWMNRRATLTVKDADGKIVSAGGVGDAIRGLNAATGGPSAAAEPKCCDEILKRLDKLDDILSAIRTLKDDNDKLKASNDTLRADVDALKGSLGKDLDKRIGDIEGSVKDVKKIEDQRESEVYQRQNGKMRFSLLGANGGVDDQGRLTFTGKGRFFAPFGTHFAFQSEGEYMYFRDRKEGQFDFGLVNRYKQVQMGLFSSFKHVDFREFKNGGTLGQASLTLDYLFHRGRVGLFGSKAFLDNAVVNQAILSRNVTLESYLRVVDQVGVSTTVGLFGNSYAEGNLGFLRSYSGDNKPGGTLRFIQPLNSHIAFTLEGGFNETLLARDSTGSVRFGIMFGNWLRPKEYGEIKSPVPADIPRLRYELLTRKVRTGNDAPVADAGPDQIGVPAGQINLDGSGSYDPEGDPITFEWRQIAGPAVSLTGATSARASFTAADSQSYAFRLTVKDDHGAQGTARVTITTKAPQQVRILRFQANPQSIKAGDKADLLWLIENADSAEISGVGKIDPKQGTISVSPKETTTYTITARNSVNEVKESLTVTVERPAVRIITFQATPSTINKGDSSTLAWQTENADEVTITELGKVNVNGSRQVTPEDTTTYTITARNAFGSATATATVQVGNSGVNQLPRIIRFTASPVDITSGDKSTLSWLVENATTVAITSLGTVGLEGSAPVGPTINTIYTITATNSFGQVSSTVGINVKTGPPPPTPPSLTACLANPTSINTPGQSVSISYTATNINVVTLNGLGVSNPVIVKPTQTTTYTLIGYGANNVTASCQVQVILNQIPEEEKPIVNPGSSIDTIYRELTLDGSKSFNPSGGPLTYKWRIVDHTAAITDPTAAVTRVQLGELFGPYTFELTVTNQKGISASARVVVNFVSTKVF